MKLAFGGNRRLRRHAEFVVAQRLGQRVGTKHFTLLVAARQPALATPGVTPGPAPLVVPGAASGDGTAVESALPAAALPSRIGLVVSRKVGGAIQRNRIKRLCRECFRTWPDLVPPGIDLVVIARGSAAELRLADVRADWSGVTRLLRKRAAEALARRVEAHHLGGNRSIRETGRS